MESPTAPTSTSSIFNDLAPRPTRAIHKSHLTVSSVHRTSPRKLNMLSRQIANLPIDEAILQMQFSDKRSAAWIAGLLVLAKDGAVEKALRAERLIVGESWVSKGRAQKRLDIKGRGKFGMKTLSSARLHVVLKEGLTKVEKAQKEFKKELGKVRGPGYAGVREDGVLRRKVISGWTW